MCGGATAPFVHEWRQATADFVLSGVDSRAGTGTGTGTGADMWAQGNPLPTSSESCPRRIARDPTCSTCICRSCKLWRASVLDLPRRDCDLVCRSAEGQRAREPVRGTSATGSPHQRGLDNASYGVTAATRPLVVAKCCSREGLSS